MKSKRIQFEASDDQVKLIEELMELSGVATKTEFLRNAIALMKWAIDKSAEGSVIAAVNEKDKVYRELQMPALVTAANKARIESEVRNETAGAA